MGSILGLGRGKKNASLALSGFDFLKDNEGINAAQNAGTAATNSFAGALGLPGFQAPDEAFEQFKNSSGFQQQLRGGQEAITGSAAARGMLNSGSTLKRLQEFGQGLAQQSHGDFLDRLIQSQQLGQQAALGTGAAGTSGGSTAASTQPQNKGIFGRLFGI